MTIDEALASFAARLGRARAIERADVDERLALALDERVPAMDARVEELDGLLRLFVAIGWRQPPAKKKGKPLPPPVRVWFSRYLFDVRDVDRILADAASAPVRVPGEADDAAA